MYLLDVSLATILLCFCDRLLLAFSCSAVHQSRRRCVDAVLTLVAGWHEPSVTTGLHTCIPCDGNCNSVITGRLQRKSSIDAIAQAGQKGVLIRRIEPTAPVNKVLKKGDILLSFDSIDIANDGTVPFRSGERISFNYLVSKKYTNEQVKL